jgi:Tfp pilus assembly protein PilF
MPAVTLAALFCGLAVIASARRGDGAHALRPRTRFTALSGTVALAGFVLLGLLGNSAVSASSKATDAGQSARAESEARRAMSFAPWSSAPWRRLGEAEASAGDRRAASASFRKAIAKDRNDWTLWFELAEASSGAEQRRAFADALRLNPLSSEIATARAQLSGK